MLQMIVEPIVSQEVKKKKNSATIMQFAALGATKLGWIKMSYKNKFEEKILPTSDIKI